MELAVELRPAALPSWLTLELLPELPVTMTLSWVVSWESGGGLDDEGSSSKSILS